MGPTHYRSFTFFEIMIRNVPHGGHSITNALAKLAARSPAAVIPCVSRRSDLRPDAHLAAERLAARAGTGFFFDRIRGMVLTDIRIRILKGFS